MDPLRSGHGNQKSSSRPVPCRPETRSPPIAVGQMASSATWRHDRGGDAHGDAPNRCTGPPMPSQLTIGSPHGKALGDRQLPSVWDPFRNPKIPIRCSTPTHSPSYIHDTCALHAVSALVQHLFPHSRVYMHRHSSDRTGGRATGPPTRRAKCLACCPAGRLQ